jgi:hypothetical protein
MKATTQAAQAERIILALLEHNTQERAAAALGMSASTIRRRMLIPEFQELYREARRQQYSHIIRRAQQAAPLAARTLSLIMVDKSAPTAVRSRASRSILSRANSHQLEDLVAQVENLEQIQRDDKLMEAALVKTHREFSHGPRHHAKSPVQAVGQRTQRKDNISTAKMDRIIFALFEHGSHVKAADACGLSPVTIWRWTQKPAFQEQYRKALRETYSRAMAILQQGASAAVSFQMRLMNDKDAPAGVRVQAAEFILDLASTGAQEDLQERIDVLKKARKEIGQ